VESIDAIEKLVKEYDIRVGFHNHPRRPNDASYKNVGPELRPQRGERSRPRIGSTADIGHWVRSGLDPLDCLKILQGRHHQHASQGFERKIPGGA